jgi:uncharacterized membrane protein
MTRWAWLACAVALLIAPQLQAQHRGSHGAGTGAGQAGASPNDSLSDFKRAVALQASPEQTLQFQQWTKDTDIARKSAQQLLKAASGQNTQALSDALDDAETDHDRFLGSFSAEQRTGLKDLTKKLAKANSEVAKQSKVLRGSGAPAGEIEKLDMALGDLQASQAAIGREMGIGVERNSQ